MLSPNLSSDLLPSNFSPNLLPNIASVATNDSLNKSILSIPSDLAPCIARYGRPDRSVLEVLMLIGVVRREDYQAYFFGLLQKELQNFPVQLRPLGITGDYGWLYLLFSSMNLSKTEENRCNYAGWLHEKRIVPCLFYYRRPCKSCNRSNIQPPLKKLLRWECPEYSQAAIVLIDYYHKAYLGIENADRSRAREERQERGLKEDVAKRWPRDKEGFMETMRYLVRNFKELFIRDEEYQCINTLEIIDKYAEEKDLAAIIRRLPEEIAMTV